MDTERANQIINSRESVQVLYRGSPVWLEKVRDNNTVEVTQMDSKKRLEVPAYLLVENSPVDNI